MKTSIRESGGPIRRLFTTGALLCALALSSHAQGPPGRPGPPPGWPPGRPWPPGPPRVPEIDAGTARAAITFVVLGLLVCVCPSREDELEPREEG